MSDYTIAEIKAVFGEHWDFLADCSDGFKQEVILRSETVEAEKIASDEGGEGHGEDIWVVVKAGTQLFEKCGYYRSHYDSEWDGLLTEVKPVEKTITVYQAA